MSNVSSEELLEACKVVRSSYVGHGAGAKNLVGEALVQVLGELDIHVTEDELYAD